MKRLMIFILAVMLAACGSFGTRSSGGTYGSSGAYGNTNDRSSLDGPTATGSGARY